MTRAMMKIPFESRSIDDLLLAQAMQLATQKVTRIHCAVRSDDSSRYELILGPGAFVEFTLTAYLCTFTMPNLITIP